MKSSKKILISGATGMLGQALVKELLNKSAFAIYYVSNSNTYSIQGANFLNIEELKAHNFYAFFHCAAEVNVNLCENDILHAKKSNYYYTKLLFKKVNSQYNFFISTDSVYEGIEGNYGELDKTKPINNYALSKLMGEKAAFNAKNNLYIIRTNIVGENSKSKKSLFEWARFELLSGNSIKGYSNIFFNPLSVQHLSLVMLLMLEKKVQFGIYNLGSDTYISKYDFLIEVANLFGISPSKIEPEEFKVTSEIARRPMNTTLNCEKIKQQLINLDLSFKTSLGLLSKSIYEQN